MCQRSGASDSLPGAIKALAALCGKGVLLVCLRSRRTLEASFRCASLPLHPSVLLVLLPRGTTNRWLAEWAQRSKEGSHDLAANDFVIVHCRLRPDGRCDVGDCLEKLYSMGFKSLMVEVHTYMCWCSSFFRWPKDCSISASCMRHAVHIRIAPSSKNNFKAINFLPSLSLAV